MEDGLIGYRRVRAFISIMNELLLSSMLSPVPAERSTYVSISTESAGFCAYVKCMTLAAWLACALVSVCAHVWG